jgi:O-antigen/teichoic acid export membrane protein
MLELIQISIINVVAKLLKFSFELGTSFFVSKETYGQFALILSYIMIFTKISSFGIQNIMVRDVQKYSNKKYISYIFFNSAITIFAVSILLFVVLYLFSFEYIIYYPIIFIIFLLSSFTILYSTYLRSIKEVKSWIYFQDIQIYLIYFSLLAILYITQNQELSIDFILNIYTLATIGAFLSVLLYIRFKREIYLLSKVSFEKIKYITSHSMPVLFTGLTYLVISRIDIIMLEKYVSLELVGEYNIIARVTLQVLFFNQVIVSYYYPRLAKMFADKKEMSDIASYNTKFVLLSFGSVSLISLALFVAINSFALFDILNIINKTVLYDVFLILAITQIIYSAMSFYGNILIYIHKQKMEYLNNFLVLLLAILLNIIFIPKYGVVGAAIATSLALILGNFLQMIQVKYFTGTFFVAFSSTSKKVAS